MKFFLLWVFMLGVMLATNGHASDRQETGKSEKPGALALQADDSLVTSAAVSRAPEDTMIAFPDLSNAPEFDGIDPREADRFWDRWPLMTVRYRNDNGELRFVYANEIAWSAIKSGATTYPEGSMIGKVGIKTEPDALFPNSLAPSSSVRIQLMRKDSKKYAKHNGWGYAIYYVTKSQDQPDDESDIVEACHACHQIAKSRDYIFAKAAYIYRVAPEEEGFETLFRQMDVSTSKLSELASEALLITGHPRSEPIQFLSMPLFSGSLYVSADPLAAYASQRNRTYLLIDERNGYFLVAKPLPANESCKSNVHMVMRTKLKDKSPYIRTGVVCNGMVKWEPITDTNKAMQ